MQDHRTPFRGRAIRVIDRDRPFESLPIDFALLERRKANDYEKLDRMVAYAETAGCRQFTILDYFGDPQARPCGICDNCGGVARHRVTLRVTEPATAADELRAVRPHGARRSRADEGASGHVAHCQDAVRFSGPGGPSPGVGSAQHIRPVCPFAADRGTGFPARVTGGQTWNRRAE